MSFIGSEKSSLEMLTLMLSFPLLSVKGSLMIMKILLVTLYLRVDSKLSENFPSCIVCYLGPR